MQAICEPDCKCRTWQLPQCVKLQLPASCPCSREHSGFSLCGCILKASWSSGRIWQHELVLHLQMIMLISERSILNSQFFGESCMLEHKQLLQVTRSCSNYLQNSCRPEKEPDSEIAGQFGTLLHPSRSLPCWSYTEKMHITASDSASYPIIRQQWNQPYINHSETGRGKQ